jgi:deoxyadenosine/deoxycytidine kinase
MVLSTLQVFVRAVHEAKWMSDAEISIYDSWFDPVVSAMPGLVPDAFIYLRATPDTCLRRLHSRNREEETSVTLDYLRGLHEKHEQWLFPAQRSGNNVVSVSEWPSMMRRPLSPRLQDRVLYLEGENVHSSIQKVR